MRILLFGATGMVGQGVLRECLRAADVDYVQTVGRTPTGQLDPRLHDLVHHDLTDYRSIEASLKSLRCVLLLFGRIVSGDERSGLYETDL